jgi:hypothetical protein
MVEIIELESVVILYRCGIIMLSYQFEIAVIDKH